MEYREFRAESVGVDDEGVLEGLVTPFGRETVIGDLKRGGFREKVAAGAFTKTLDEGDPLLVYQHDLAKPLARKSAGNLDIHEGEYEGQAGLVMRATPVDTTYAGDLRKLVKAKVIRGMSFGFNVVKDRWTDDEGREADKYTGTRRELLEVRLVEASPVTRPAYDNTAISARDEASALLESRAAKATYADLETCGECGSTNQFGSFCSNCGKPMAQSKPSGDYCTSCGSKIDTKNRSAHECDEGREAPEVTITGSDYTDMAARLITAYNALPDEDREALPEGLREAIEAVRDDPDGKEYGAIDKAVSLLAKSPPDTKGALSVLHANQAQRSSQEPEASTPDDEDDFALRVAFREAEERSRELGSVEA
jgi:HK97 family phage prohead protease